MLIFNKSISLIGTGLHIPVFGGIEPLSIHIQSGEYSLSTSTLIIRSGTLNYIGGLVRGPADITDFIITLRDKLTLKGRSCVHIPIVGYSCAMIDQHIQCASTTIHNHIHTQLVQ